MRIMYLLYFLAVFVMNTAHALTIQEIKTKEAMHPIWLVEEHSLPIIALDLVIKKAGSAYDPKGKEGLSQMMTSLFSEGAGDKHALEYQKELAKAAIELSFSSDEDRIYIHMKCLEEQWEKGLEYLTLALKNPRFDADKIEEKRKEKESALLQEEQSVESYAYKQAKLLLYGSDHPYGRNMTRGSIRAIQQVDLHRFLKGHMAKEHMLISIVGDISPARVEKTIGLYFDEFSEKTDVLLDLPKIKIKEYAAPVYMNFDTKQANIIFSQNAIDSTHPHFYDLALLNHIFGGTGLHSRLMENLRQKHGLTYSVSSWIGDTDAVSYLRGSFLTENEKSEEALAGLKETIDTLREKGMTQEELHAAKKYALHGLTESLDTNSKTTELLSSVRLRGQNKEYINAYPTLIQSVTLDNVNKIAAQLLEPGKWFYLIVGSNKEKTE